MKNHIIICNFLDFYELSFALTNRWLKKLFFVAFVKWQNFFKFSGYFGRKDLKQYGKSERAAFENFLFYSAEVILMGLRVHCSIFVPVCADPKYRY
jgi:hypothetical protein